MERHILIFHHHFSGIIFLMSKFYRRHELVFRIGVFLALSPSLSGAIGGFLATGFLQSGDVGSITDDWRKICTSRVE